MNNLSRMVSLLFVLLVLMGCASTQTNSSNEFAESPIVTLSILPEKTVANRFGVDRKTNPYFPQSVLILPSKEEFVVLELGISSKQSILVEFDYARIVSEVGGRIGVFLNKPGLIEYWNKQANTEMIDHRMRKIDASYLPDWVFDRKPGKRSYILVLSGKRPLPRPFNVEARLWVNHEEFSFTLPVTE